MPPTRKPKAVDPEHLLDGLPLPRPEGQLERADETTGEEGGAGFYGPSHERESAGKKKPRK